MTEAEWLTSADPAAMLVALHTPGDPVTDLMDRPVSARKLRLFACGSCRAVWDGAVCAACKRVVKESSPVCSTSPVSSTWVEVVRRVPVMRKPCPDCHAGLTDPRGRRAVEVSERFADGEATAIEMKAVWRKTPLIVKLNPLANMTCWDDIADACRLIAAGSCQPAVPPATQAALLRCVVGNPFRPVVKPCTQQAWRCDWLTPTVVHLAQTIYDERRWDALPILADALEEAGCPREVACPGCKGTGMVPFNSLGTAAPCWVCRLPGAYFGTGRVPHPLLAALRGPGPWCRGFWALDLLLGKE